MSEENPTAWELLLVQSAPAEPQNEELQREGDERIWPDDFRGISVKVKWVKGHKDNVNHGDVINP